MESEKAKDKMKQNALEFLEKFITTELPNKTVDDLKTILFGK